MVALSATVLRLEPLSDDAGETQYGKYADKNIAGLAESDERRLVRQ